MNKSIAAVDITASYYYRTAALQFISKAYDWYCWSGFFYNKCCTRRQLFLFVLYFFTKKKHYQLLIMILPVRCFSCGKMIGNIWEKYQKLLADGSTTEE
jgi:hypothetical protein